MRLILLKNKLERLATASTDVLTYNIPFSRLATGCSTKLWLYVNVVQSRACESRILRITWNRTWNALNMVLSLPLGLSRCLTELHSGIVLATNFDPVARATL